jgi:hypothetical protein
MGLTSHPRHFEHFTQDGDVEYRCPVFDFPVMLVFTLSYFFVITYELKEGKCLHHLAS